MIERYEKIQANICNGALTWKYKLSSSPVFSFQSHDEDVSLWTDDQIIGLTCSMLDVEDNQKRLIEVIWN